ncbi:putative sensor with HAMP domain protein [Calothrix sp. NIES-4071]|nr:putative sensor with HAMP domain protein [Calothrix sp. NIES-4071]BAZ60453.1 putative sensor with HAMP domain protein [Calothrix sp. NIES-4105]
MKINTKVNLILIIVFICGIFISGTALANVLERKTESEVSSKAVMLMQIANSIRQYTNEKVQPLLLPKVETEQKFIPESIPSFSIREVFQIFHQNKDYANFTYKDATLNPTNLQDKADNFESNIVKEFRKNPALPDRSGFRTDKGEKRFYTARPFKIEHESCLQCHSTPEKAPKSQLATYGSENGFGWKLHDIVAAQIVYIPAEEIFNQASRSFVMVLSLLGAIFTAIVVIINLLLKKIVLKRIKRIAAVAEQVSIGDMNANFGKQDKDEIGALAEAFNRMKYSLEIALNMLNNPR